MKMDKRINIDVLRFLCTLFVVAIHVYPFTFLGEDIDYMITRVFFRIAVPIFLMITGYYLLPKSLEHKKKLILYTKKILSLYFISILIYLPFLFYNGYFKQKSMLSFLQDIFINGTFYHLWYFPALLLGIWITYFLLKKYKQNQVGIVVFLFYLIGIFGDSYYGIIKDIALLRDFYDVLFTFSTYTRNGLFYVPIFLFIGYLIAKKEEQTIQSMPLLFLSGIALLCEGGILYFNEIPKHNSMYFSLLPFSYFFFSFVIANRGGNHTNLRAFASWIYILHPIFIILAHFMAKRIPILNHSFVHYGFVLLLTISFLFFLNWIREGIQCGKKENDQ